MKKNRASRPSFVCEQLETRLLLSHVASLPDANPTLPDNAGDYHAVIVAGNPNGSPADSPGNRVDANTTKSPFAGVGSLQVNTNRGTYICTATPIAPQYVLTAGHCADINDDGRSDRRDGIRSITFNLNYGGNLTSRITAASWTVNPDFTGFNRPVGDINDDLTIVKLSNPLPAGVPVYAYATNQATDPLLAHATLTLVGYGTSGDGVGGYYVNPSFSVKRTGQNIADTFTGQDDSGKPAAKESFQFDFDGPNGNGLGNDKETTLGGGDSGGPSFVLKPGADPSLASSYVLVGVNTYTQGKAPYFGSYGGGIVVSAYANWINSVLTSSASASSLDAGATGGGHSGHGASRGAGVATNFAVVIVGNPVSSDTAAIAVTASAAHESSSETGSGETVAIADTDVATNGTRSETATTVIVSAPESSAPRAAETAHQRRLATLDDVIGSFSPIFND